jgi:hypothetical protein
MRLLTVVGFIFCAIAASARADVITGAGTQVTHVKVFDGATNSLKSSLIAYPGFQGGVRVAAGDVTGDGTADIVTGVGPASVGGHVKVFDGRTGAEVRSFLAFEGFSGGVYVGSGDIDDDGFADIVTGVDEGAAAGHVKVFHGETNTLLRSFFAYSGGFTGGVRVAAGDVNGDGFADIITGTGPGAPGGHVKVFDGVTNAELSSFLAYGGFAGGVYVASGDLDGDGYGDIITGAGDGAPGGHVKVFDGRTGGLTHSFFAYPTMFNGGVRVAAGDLDGDGLADIITGAGPGAPGGHVKAFSGVSGAELRSFLAYEGTTGGVYVAGTEVIPEPSSMILVLVGAGMAWIGPLRRRACLERQVN